MISSHSCSTCSNLKSKYLFTNQYLDLTIQASSNISNVLHTIHILVNDLNHIYACVLDDPWIILAQYKQTRLNSIFTFATDGHDMLWYCTLSVSFYQENKIYKSCTFGITNTHFNIHHAFCWSLNTDYKRLGYCTCMPILLQ